MDDFDWERWAERASHADITQQIIGFRNAQKNIETQKLLQQLLDQKKEEEARLNSLPDCPFCGNKIPKLSVKICGQCRQEIIWVGVVPCSPEDANREREKQAREREKQARARELQAREQRSRAAKEARDHKKHLFAKSIADANYNAAREPYVSRQIWYIFGAIFIFFICAVITYLLLDAFILPEFVDGLFYLLTFFEVIFTIAAILYADYRNRLHARKIASHAYEKAFNTPMAIKLEQKSR